MNRKSTEMTLENKNETSAEVSTAIVEKKNELVKQDFDIDGFLDMRKQFITKVNKIMVKGSDYHEIQSKKSLAKGGAEKIASIFGWSATFERDKDVTEAFSTLPGLVAFVCNLEKSGTLVGQGRGAATLTKNAGDPNKTIKMAQKSAFIDAVLRASGLSDFFTQDLEDMNQSDITQYQAHTATYAPTYTKQIKPATEKQKNFINSLLRRNTIDETILKKHFPNYDYSTVTMDEATEIIEFLKDYKSGDAYKIFETDLNDCTNLASLNKIGSEIKMAHDNGKITDTEFDFLVQIGTKARERLAVELGQISDKLDF